MTPVGEADKLSPNSNSPSSVQDRGTHLKVGIRSGFRTAQRINLKEFLHPFLVKAAAAAQGKILPRSQGS